MPGHRIAACLGKAALKTRALQTLPRRPLTQPEARSVWSASDLSALCARRGTAAVHGPNACGKNERGLSINLPGHRIVACLGKAALKTHALQTLRDCRASPNRAKRLDCVRFIGAFHAARNDQCFMAPMCAQV